MLRTAFCSLSLLAVSAACAGSPEKLAAEESTPRSATSAPRAKLAYPAATRGDTVDRYHGVDVADPYRWLEDPDSPQSRAWIEQQNALTFGYLESIPERAAMRERLTELWNYERFGVPRKKGSRYFFTKNDGLQPQAIVYVADALRAAPRVLLDPNALSKDGTVALSDYAPSDDGRLVAYGIADGGSDWTTWRVRDVETGTDLADTIRWVKFNSPAWTPSGSGFFYARYDEPKAGAELEQVNKSPKVYFHAIGTDQSADALIYERPDQPEWGYACQVSDDGKYLVIVASQGTDTRNRIFYKRLEVGREAEGGVASVIGLCTDFDASYNFFGGEGERLFFVTDLDAPRGRVIAIDVDRPDRASWKELVPQHQDTLQNASAVGRSICAVYLHDAHSKVRVHGLDGAERGSVELPSLGTASGFGGHVDDQETFFSFASFAAPSSIHRLDMTSLKTEPYLAPKISFDSSRFASEQVFFESKDGTRVPMFLVYRKGLERNGRNPTLLYGYGGFNVSLTPSYNPARIAWLELGGLYAVPNLRGGGEYGEDWHKAGSKLVKQNVFDDFIAAAQWLIDNDYTSSERLAIQGASNGGLLVGACITQRPDLFGAALPAVGVMDMLRFREFTIGWAWESDYGSVKDPDEFRAIYAYSPLHRLEGGTCYPATMVTTADHDDRVVPAHSFKFAAALQHAQGCENPALIRIDVRSGHGAGKPTSKQIEQAADEIAFLIRELGIEAR